jgi:hypothetical protein
MAIDRKTALELVATLREREVALEGVARKLPPGTPRDELLEQLEALRAFIETLKPK